MWSLVSTLLLLTLACRQAAGFTAAQHTKAGSSWKDLRLDCRSYRRLAIHAAKASSNITSCVQDLAPAVNSKCSGLTHCYFSYRVDQKEKICEDDALTVSITYACVPEEQLHRYCNVRLTATTGYVASPGYPRYLPALASCRWAVEVPRGLSVVVQPLDVACGPDTHLSAADPAARLAVLVPCPPGPRAVLPARTSAHRLEITLHNPGFVPARGFLFYYKAQGCPTLSPPKQGYLVYRKPDVAVYKCYNSLVFSDTGFHSKTLWCEDQTYWNESVGSCVEEPAHNSSSLAPPPTLVLAVEPFQPRSNASSMMTEVVLPSLLVIVLLLVNIIIVIIVLRIQRKSGDFKGEEEEIPSLTTMTDPT